MQDKILKFKTVWAFKKEEVKRNSRHRKRIRIVIVKEAVCLENVYWDRISEINLKMQYFLRDEINLFLDGSCAVVQINYSLVIPSK